MTRAKFLVLLVIALIAIFIAGINQFGFGGLFGGGMAVGIFLILFGRRNNA